MKIGILGTSTVGRTLGARLSELGHDVMLGTRNVANTLARTEPGRDGQPGFGLWRRDHPAVKLGSFAETAGHGDVIINATNGAASLDVLLLVGQAKLNDRILIDVSKPLDTSHGMPPKLAVCNTDSLGEQIQRTFPGAKVVKTLNTVSAAVMVNPALLAGGDHTLFLSGNDPAASPGEVMAWGVVRLATLLAWVTSRGLRQRCISIWLRLLEALGTGLLTSRWSSRAGAI
jgi:predicted dinucleotide-binding enzyme